MTTLHDVAYLAGVKKSTVSNVINNKGSVREETRDRVLAAMAELQYVPNPVARGLKQGKTFVLALVVPMITNPFYAEIVETVEQIAKQHGYHLLLSIASKGEEHTRYLLSTLSSRSIDGLVLMVGRINEQELQKLVQRHIPVVAVAIGFMKSVSVVNIDDPAVGSLAAEHLLGLGHRRIGVITELQWHGTRVQGFTDTLAHKGVTLAPEYIQSGEATFESGYAVAQALLALPLPPTAIFATNDVKALGAMQAAVDRGLSVPDQLSIVGVDNIAQTEYARPPLTTIALPRRDLGQEAIELLLRWIEHPQQHSPVTVLVRPEIVIRGSTGPCISTE